MFKRSTCDFVWVCPTCRDQIRAKQPKEDGLTELRKDTEKGNRRLASQLEAFQERLLKKVEDMMNRGPEARDIQATQPYRSSVVRTTKRKPPPPTTTTATTPEKPSQTPNRELKKNRQKIVQQEPSKRRTCRNDPRKGNLQNNATRLERRKSLGQTNRQMHHRRRNQQEERNMALPG